MIDRDRSGRSWLVRSRGVARSIIIHAQIPAIAATNLSRVASAGKGTVDLVGFVETRGGFVANIAFRLVFRTGEDILACLRYCLAKIVGIGTIGVGLF